MTEIDAVSRALWEQWNIAGGPNYPSEMVIRYCLRTYTREERQGLRALDLGCGSGANSWFLTREGFDVIATDISRAGIKHTLARLGHDGLQAEMRCESADCLGVESESIDLVICIGVLESVGPLIAEGSVSEASRVLCKGGRGLFLFAGEGDFRIGDATGLGLHGYTRDETEALFRPHFSNVCFDQCITTFENKIRRQVDWIVTVIR